MKNLFAIISFTLLLQYTNAQEIILLTSLTPITVTEKDSVIIITKLVSTSGDLPFSNDITFTTNPYPFVILPATPTGTGNLPVIEALKAYPNPATGMVTLQREKEDETYYVRLFNENGSTLFEQSWNGGRSTMHVLLDRFANGLLFLTVTNEQGTKSSQFKIVKQ